MTINNTANRPLQVDYKNSGFHDNVARPARRQHRVSRSILLSARSAPSRGAVRVNSQTEPRFKHLKKLALGLLAVSGGFLFTTQSNGTVDNAKPALTTVAALVSPTFFFNDSDNALGDEQPLLAGTSTNRTIKVPNDLVKVAAMSGVGSSYTSQPTDTQSALAAVEFISPFGDNDTTPKTTSISPLVNHPSIAAIRKKAEFPDGATEETVTVSAGDTLSKLLNDRGVKIEQMPQLLTDEVIKKYLSNLRIGQQFNVVRLANGDFHSLSAKVGNDRRITIRRGETGFAIASIDLPVEKERVVTSGTIEQSLYVAAEQADLKQSTIMELSDIFQWELDFARDIRKGDNFSLVYDRLYREGKYIGDGDILAAEFVRGGKRYQAVRYTDPVGNTGYYSPDGRSKRRTFLRHPVDVVRITSRFDPNRVHPVLHKIRAHKGVDYGSPIGTPIRATANGTVKFAGRKSAYGKTVILSHGTDIRTLYAHMSRISDKVKNGKRVKQGDVIGYVGATGRVTGAHLHYEFQKNGKHVDPLKVELPAAEPLQADLRDELRDLSDDLFAQMKSVIPDATEQVAAAQ